MTVSSDVPQIESRIVDAVRDFMAMEAGQEIAPSCRTLADAVSMQAVASSEGGKRLRARLVLDAFDAVDRHRHAAPAYRESVLDLACAIELFQTAALVHDDIIDESDLRRGKPSAHKALAAAAHNPAIGKGLGIMLGDLLATASVDLANRAARGLVSSDAIMTAFLGMHREVEIGQVLDLAVELNPLDDPERLVQASLNVFRWKTASYTTIAPLRFAMLAAGYGPDDADRHALAIGKPLGQAFQLADDLLDVIGSSRNTGKPVGGDIREGKRTVLLADAIAASDERQRGILIDLFEAPSRDDAAVKQVIGLFESTGAIDRSQHRIRTLWNQAYAAISGLSLSADAERPLIEACRRFVPLAEA